MGREGLPRHVLGTESEAPQKRFGWVWFFQMHSEVTDCEWEVPIELNDHWMVHIASYFIGIVIVP